VSRGTKQKTSRRVEGIKYFNVSAASTPRAIIQYTNTPIHIAEKMIESALKPPAF
jgi:hypothetical protein